MHVTMTTIMMLMIIMHPLSFGVDPGGGSFAVWRPRSAKWRSYAARAPRFRDELRCGNAMKCMLCFYI